ncbi:MAG: lysophospholipase [Paraglaciecola sp.]|jgi:lysophospholipase
MTDHYLLSQETQLQHDYPALICPLMQKLQYGEFMGVDKVNIVYAFLLHPCPIGSVVISSGRIECLLKYQELIYDLYQNGYCVFIHDHRGQGFSGRMTDNSHMGYVQDFTDYVTDFKIFYDTVIKLKSEYQPQLLCHSMGGAIGALYVHAYPQDFGHVVFSAPMFGIRPPMPAWLVTGLLRLNELINTFSGKPTAYFFGQGNYENIHFADSQLTHSEVRYRLFREEYERQPRVQLGGVTCQWLKAARAAMDKIESLAGTLSIPALVLQAGADQVVDNKRQDLVVASMPHCKKVVIKGAKHELLMEEDKYRMPCLVAALDFFKQP